MPNDAEEWYKQQVENGKLPDENGRYNYVPLADEEIISKEPQPSYG